MSFVWCYLIVAAFCLGDFLSTDRHEGRLTYRAGLFGLFASLIWPLGIALTYTPKKWWSK